MSGRVFNSFTCVALGIALAATAYGGVETQIGEVSSWLLGWDAVKGADGTLYVTWSDNHYIKLAVSADNGKTWNITEPSTAHDGTFRSPVMAVDGNGNVFIFARWHPAYPGNPDPYSAGTIDIYAVTNVTGSWTEELVIEDSTYHNGYSSSNNSALPWDAFVDAADNVHLFLNHYYWWSYGGQVWEKIRSPGQAGTWGDLIKAIHIYTSSVDTQTHGSENVVQTSDGGAAIISLNSTGGYAFYVTRSAAGAWSAPTTIATAPNYGDVTLDVDEKDHIHALYMGPDYRTLNYVRNWGTPETVLTLPGENDRCPYSVIDADAYGHVSIEFRSYDYPNGVYTWYMTRVERDEGEPWSDPVPYADLVTSVTEVVSVQRFQMYHGGAFNSPLEWIYYGPSGTGYPLTIRYWREEEDVEVLLSDINEDGYIDDKDMMILMSEWHRGAPPQN